MKTATPRRELRRPLALLLLLVVSTATAAAGEDSLWRIGLSAGLGGTEDSEPSPGYDASALQLSVAMIGQAGSQLVLRIGRIDFDDEPLGGLEAPELRWATLGGEYRLRGRWFDSGLFLALGGYQLEGIDALGTRDETTWGLSFGSTAEWRLSRHVSIDAELSGHWADFDEAQFFAVGLVGLSVHF